MNRPTLFCLLVAIGGSAFAAKPCEELKTEIAAKLDAKQLAGYTLEIVSKDAEVAGTVVGTCEGGSKKIMYSRGAGAAKSTSDEAKQ